MAYAFVSNGSIHRSHRAGTCDLKKKKTWNRTEIEAGRKLDRVRREKQSRHSLMVRQAGQTRIRPTESLPRLRPGCGCNCKDLSPCNDISSSTDTTTLFLSSFSIIEQGMMVVSSLLICFPHTFEIARRPSRSSLPNRKFRPLLHSSTMLRRSDVFLIAPTKSPISGVSRVLSTDAMLSAPSASCASIKS